MPIYDDSTSPVGKTIPLQQSDIVRMRGALGGDDGDRSIAAKAYNLDPGFRKAADHYRSQQLDPQTQKRLPSLLLNRYYYGKWEIEKTDPLTSALAQDSVTPSRDPFNPFPAKQVGFREMAKGIANLGAQSLPVVGGIVGGLVGGIGAAPTVAGIVPGAIAGAGIGAAAGEAGKQAGQRLLGTAPDRTIGQELGGIATQGAIGALSEGAGQIIVKGATKLAQTVAPALKESAKANVGRVLAPTTKMDKAATQKISQQILDRPLKDTVSLTRKGMLEKAAAQVESSGEAILDFPQLAGRTSTDDIIKVLEAKKGDFIVGGKAIVPEAIKKIDDVQATIRQFGDVIHDADMQTVGRILSKEVAKGKNAFLQSADEASKVEVQKLASNAIRSTLSEKYPDLAKLNKEFHFWKTMEDVLANTVARKTGQSTGIVKNIATIAGAATPGTPIEKGMYAAAMRFIATAVQSPGWGIVSGKMKNNLADALLKGTSKELSTVLQKVIQATLQTSLTPDTAK